MAFEHKTNWSPAYTKNFDDVDWSKKPEEKKPEAKEEEVPEKPPVKEKKAK